MKRETNLEEQWWLDRIEDDVIGRNDRNIDVPTRLVRFYREEVAEPHGKRRIRWQYYNIRNIIVFKNQNFKKYHRC